MGKDIFAEEQGIRVTTTPSDCDAPSVYGGKPAVMFIIWEKDPSPSSALRWCRHSRRPEHHLPLRRAICILTSMAARTRKIFHDEDTRARIKATAIIRRLQDYALGSEPDAMSRNQVSAAVALLNKVLPNLGSADIQPEPTKTYVLRVPCISNSVQEWLRDYGPADQVLNQAIEVER